MTKKELIEILNAALELEHAARVQYLAHAEQIDGLNAEPIITRLKEIADDEKKTPRNVQRYDWKLSRWNTLDVHR